jgi:hypothetical protein
VQGTEPAAPARSRHDDEEDSAVFWPSRPSPGSWRKDFQTSVRTGFGDRLSAAGNGQEPALATERGHSDKTATIDRTSGDSGLHGKDVTTVSGSGYAALAATWRRNGSADRPRHGGRHKARRLTSAASNFQLGPVVDRVRTGIRGAARGIAARAGNANLAGKRQFLIPAITVLCAVVVLFGIVRTIKGQQARQLQQRFDSLVTAAAQLESQARTDGDRNEAQGLVRRSQALLDQAGALQPNQQRVAALRKDLQADLDRLDNVLPLPDPAILTNFGSVAKDVNSGAMAVDATAMYALDGGQRVLQFLRQSKQASAAATKGDKSGANQLGAPKLLALRDAGLLILDGNRNLWSYSSGSHNLQQIGLKSADTWKDPTAMAAYGPNLYVLDAALGNIFRYASRDGIFTDQPSRFFEKDNPDVLRQSVAIHHQRATSAAGQGHTNRHASRLPVAVRARRRQQSRGGDRQRRPLSAAVQPEPTCPRHRLLARRASPPVVRRGRQYAVPVRTAVLKKAPSFRTLSPPGSRPVL